MFSFGKKKTECDKCGHKLMEDPMYGNLECPECDNEIVFEETINYDNSNANENGRALGVNVTVKGDTFRDSNGDKTKETKIKERKEKLIDIWKTEIMVTLNHLYTLTHGNTNLQNNDNDIDNDNHILNGILNDNNNNNNEYNFNANGNENQNQNQNNQKMETWNKEAVWQDIETIIRQFFHAVENCRRDNENENDTENQEKIEIAKNKYLKGMDASDHNRKIVAAAFLLIAERDIGKTHTHNLLFFFVCFLMCGACVFTVLCVFHFVPVCSHFHV